MSSDSNNANNEKLVDNLNVESQEILITPE